MSAVPTVSVLLPVRNGLPWIERALASVQAQTLADLEIIVLEDGSTDDTPRWLATVSDDRLQVIATGGVGIARALNLGLAAARAPYIARQDADDESRPDRFAAQVAVLDARPDIDVVASTADYIDQTNTDVVNDWVRAVRAQHDPAASPDDIRRLMPLTCCVTHGSIVARTHVLRDAGGYRDALVPAEDYDLWLRLLPSHRFLKLADRLYRYRLHPGQTAAQASTSQTRQAIRAKLQYLRRTCPGLAMPARMTIVGGTRGDQWYAQAASDAGFHVVSVYDSWDVMVITDFARLSAYQAERPDLLHLGNFLVRVSRRSVLVA